MSPHLDVFDSLMVYTLPPWYDYTIVYNTEYTLICTNGGYRAGAIQSCTESNLDSI